MTARVWQYKCGTCGLEARMTVAETTAHQADCGWFACCGHCGCPTDDRSGHDDTCAEGCNDGALAVTA